jgi:hypothetical protein
VLAQQRYHVDPQPFGHEKDNRTDHDRNNDEDVGGHGRDSNTWERLRRL